MPVRVLSLIYRSSHRISMAASAAICAATNVSSAKVGAVIVDYAMALTSVFNRRTLDNFARAARRFDEQPGLPLVVASTLLVPGYVEADQVGEIARFIASIDPRMKRKPRPRPRDWSTCT